MRTEDLIGALSRDLHAVRPMASPAMQTALWLGGAVVAIGIAVFIEGLRADLQQRFMLPREALQWVGAVATGVAAALAASMLARPDRSARWALLPLPFALAWLMTLGLGCLADMARMGDDALTPRLSGGCIKFILSLGVPLGVGLLVLLRHAGPVRPGPVLALAGLASAALCSAGLSLFHHLDASLEILLSHGLAIAAVALLGRLFGRSILMPVPRSP